jgi:uncharacterized protein YndB with AHSA1/START domain
MDKIKYEIEFTINVSPQSLYEYISTPSGLSKWFADNVNSRGDKYNFIWDGSEEDAKLITKKKDSYIKLKWDEDEQKDSFFELRIQVDELTKDVSLIVTDFAEEDEVEESKLLWENQIAELKQLLGAA